MRQLLTALLVLFLGVVASAQPKTLKLYDAFFRGELQNMEGESVVVEEASTYDLLGITNWDITYDTTAMTVTIEGWAAGQSEPTWLENHKFGAKFNTVSDTMQTVTLQNPTENVGFTVAYYKRTLYMTKSRKPVTVWRREWVSCHSLDVPYFTTRTWWSTLRENKAVNRSPKVR